MSDDKESKLGSDQPREPFATIDDLAAQAEKLFLGLRKLSEAKYPLDIRRGIRGEVSEPMQSDKPSMQIKASGRTYFLDIEQTREGKNYLRITESRKGEGESWERHSIHIFPEDGGAFIQAVKDMVARLG